MTCSKYLRLHGKFTIGVSLENRFRHVVVKRKAHELVDFYIMFMGKLWMGNTQFLSIVSTYYKSVIFNFPMTLLSTDWLQ
jgi:hypothetical protein